jgi:hypothetical protein
VRNVEVNHRRSIVGRKWLTSRPRDFEFDGEGLLDCPGDLRNVCSNFLALTSATLEDKLIPDSPSTPAKEPQNGMNNGSSSKVKAAAHRKGLDKSRLLPEGFVPRLQRYGRGVLLEDNVYRLPDGQEFIPQAPTGTLGKFHHLYALVTAEQHRAGKRGSVYIRTDGRIFNYGADHADPARELFDTGYTIYDLERTGRYAETSE